MPDLPLFLVLWLVYGAALLLSAPGQLRSLRRVGITPSVGIVRLVMPELLLGTVAVALGTTLAPASGLDAPFFRALLGGGAPVSELYAQVEAAALYGVPTTALVLILYYRVFRPWTDPQDVLRGERVRVAVGLPARLLRGGVVEEILFRWGVLSTVAWLAGQVLGPGTPAAIWTGIVGAGILFGLYHLPGAAAIGVRLTPVLLATAVVVNLVLALVTGWLLWHYGLLSAILAHALVHLLWAPIDVRLLRRLEIRVAGS